MAKTETIDLASIELDPENAREHDETNMEAITKSLRRFGAGRSVVLDGSNVVRAGNGTIEAARAAGFDKLIVIEPEKGALVAVKRADWSEQEAKGYGVADNRASELAKWNLPGLQSIIDSMPEADRDSLGFTSQDMEALLGQFDIAPTDLPDMDSGDPEHSQMTFVFTAEEAVIVGEAIKKAAELGLSAAGKKGQALAAICFEFCNR